jgi:olfactory receptor
MYFFLSILSLTDISDICFISTVVPKMIVDIQTHSTVISYAECLTQMYLFIIFACMDGMLLTVMAYERFLAICHPLNYPLIMNPCLCVFLILLSFMVSILESQLHILVVLQITNLKDVEISHFFCGPSQVFGLSCTESITSNIIKYFVVTLYGLFLSQGYFSLTIKLFPWFWESHPQKGRIKPFSPVGLTCQWSAYILEWGLGSMLDQLYHLLL